MKSEGEQQKKVSSSEFLKKSEEETEILFYNADLPIC